MRFSLLWLLICIVFIAISMTALLNANRYWADGLRTALFVLLSFASVTAILGGAVTRPFWIGFALLGWIHFASVGFARPDESGHLLTDDLIEWIHSQIVRDTQVQVPLFQSGTPVGTQLQVEKRPRWEPFRVVGQCIVVACWALLGGYFAVHVARHRTNSG
jgi:hypothetical protein